MGYNTWLFKVDEWVARMTDGEFTGTEDMADCTDLADLYEDGYTPRLAAAQCLVDNGMDELLPAAVLDLL